MGLRSYQLLLGDQLFHPFQKDLASANLTHLFLAFGFGESQLIRACKVPYKFGDDHDVCNGSVIPDSNVGGKITTINKVLELETNL